MVDASASGADAARCTGSSPVLGTKQTLNIPLIFQRDFLFLDYISRLRNSAYFKILNRNDSKLSLIVGIIS